jgi:hypothetical protein
MLHFKVDSERAPQHEGRAAAGEQYPGQLAGDPVVASWCADGAARTRCSERGPALGRRAVRFEWFLVMAMTDTAVAEWREERRGPTAVGFTGSHLETRHVRNRG